jgi:hypothetical protein
MNDRSIIQRAIRVSIKNISKIHKEIITAISGLDLVLYFFFYYPKIIR